MGAANPAREFDVLLTDGHSRAALAAVRSLGQRGIRPLVLSHEPAALAFHSRWAAGKMLSPSAGEDPAGFAEFVLQQVRTHRIRLVIPVTDQALLAFDRHREVLERETCLAMASSEALRQVLDKRRNLELARRLGVPCPRQFDLAAPQQIPEMVAVLGYPIVLKRPGDPSDPHIPRFDFRVLYAHNEEELRAFLGKHCAHGMYPLFQEMAAGEVHNVCCFAAKGEVVAAHEYHSVRRLHGVGVLRRIVEPLPELVQHASNLLRALQWDGVAHVGFFVNRELQKRWYMEINGRFWGSLEGSIHAGWDFAYWTYDYFANGRIPRPGPLAVDSFTCWHGGDLLSLADYMRGGEVPATGTNPGRLGAALQYLAGFRPGIHSEVFRLGDPLPAVGEYWHLLKSTKAFVSKRLGRSRSRPEGA